MPRLSASQLIAFSHQLFTAAQVGDVEAQIVAQSLVDANLRGHDSHGVMRIPSYVQRIQEGRIHPAARLKIEKETASSIVGDGQWGLGQVIGAELTTRLIDKCKSSAIACGTLKHVAHLGRLGEFAETAAAAGLATQIVANTHGSGQRVAPVGGKRGRLGTNPICIGFPGGSSGPFVFDIGTSATAEGKVRVKKIGGQPCPPGWLLDDEGRPTTDAAKLYADPPGSILPLGGDQAYKGFGLAFMIEMLSGAMSGGNCVHPNPPPPIGNCAMFVLWNPEFFGGAEFVQHEVARLEEYVRSSPLAAGASAILLPGDPERRTLADRQTSGIELDAGNWQALVDLACTLHVSPPAV